MEQQQDDAYLDESDEEPVYLPQVDTDNAVSIWCSLPRQKKRGDKSRAQAGAPAGSPPSTCSWPVLVYALRSSDIPRRVGGGASGHFRLRVVPILLQLLQAGPSAWMAAGEEQSTSRSSDFYDVDDNDEEVDEEDEEDEEAEDEASSSESEVTVPSETLRQWRHMRERYAENQDVAGDILVHRVLMYMGHPHWRKRDPASCSPAGDIRQSSHTTLQATMAVRLEDLRQKRLRLKDARKNLKHDAGPASQIAYEALRRSVRQLKKELTSLSNKSSKAEESDESASAKKQEAAAAKEKQDS